ncbi:MAG: hypothetical protein FWC55_04500 [Firmicutes bacterium]|nr:hypothetical protein [Bacillota bacterium]
MASERVILIKGGQSNWFEQAIFIVKKNIPQACVPVDFVAEAERIIDGYLSQASAQKQTGPAPKALAPRGRRALRAALILGALVLAGLVWLAIKGL